MDKITADKYANLRPGERDLENRFSFWFPKVKDCGIPVPESIILNTPIPVINACADYLPEVVENWVKETVIPQLNAAKLGHLLFVKNSTFSGKFTASTCCLATPQTLVPAIINVNCGAMEVIMGYDGTDELVIRQRIDYSPYDVACIYNGLPFRPEYRVFYDFDTHEVLFVENYWDKEYCFPHLYDLTDRVVWESQSPRILEEFTRHKDEVAALVAEKMKHVEGLSGPWSIDIMQHGFGEDNSLTLIDMAVAEQSAYWDRRPGYTPPPKPPTRPISEMLQAYKDFMEESSN